MTHSVLVAGCSYLDVGMRQPMPPWDKINYRKYLIKGDVAAGNQAIAARVRHELSKKDFEQVVVLWSGINRIDISVPLSTWESLPNTYKFISKFNDQIWYLSGGICGSWQQGQDCPADIQSQFREHYLNQTMLSASNDTLKTIVETQQLLENKGVDYVMSFIYDIHADYNNELDVTGNKYPRTYATNRWPNWLALEHCLGQVDTESPYYDQVDWSKFPAEITPFEYCAERNMLETDHFHPTKDGLKQWFQTQLDIYLTDS